MYLFIVEDRIKGMHEDLEVVKKWCLEHEQKIKKTVLLLRRFR